MLLLDTASTLPLLADPGQAAKLGRLVAPTMVGHAMQPWRLVGPAMSILRSRGSGKILDALADQDVPTFVIHGEWDLIVPIATARSAAERANGTLGRGEARVALLAAQGPRDAAGDRGRAARVAAG